MTFPVLEARSVSRSYHDGQREFHALSNASLQVQAGEAVGIVGKSGSGKSTLMHLLALLDSPSRGEVHVKGQNATNFSGPELNRMRNRTFGFVFQQFFLTPNATVLDNVTLPLAIAGINRREAHRRGMELLEQLDLESKAKNKAIDLSGGQKQRVVIARALINDPEVIFTDEPTGNLDTTTGATVEEILFDLNRRLGITLVIVTHDRDLANRCDRTINISDGILHAQPYREAHQTSGVAA